MPFPTPSVPALPAAGIIFISYLSLFSRYNRYTGTANGDAVSAIRATGTNWLQIAVFGTALNFHYFLTPFAPRWCNFLRRTIPEPPQRAKPCRAKRRPASLAAVCLSRTRPFRCAGVEWGRARARTRSRVSACHGPPLAVQGPRSKWHGPGIVRRWRASRAPSGGAGCGHEKAAHWAAGHVSMDWRRRLRPPA